MALPAGRYGVTKNQLLKIKKLPMNTIKLIEELTEKFDLLGNAAFKNSTSVVTQSTDLVESGAVKDIVGWGNKNKFDKSKVQGIDATITQTTDGFRAQVFSHTWGSGRYDVNNPSKNTDFILSCKANVTTAGNFMRIQVYGSNDGTNYTSISATDNYSTTTDLILAFNSGNYEYIRIIFYLTNGTASSADVTFEKPMIRLASVTDATYEPYHASVEETLRDAEVIEGKNLFGAGYSAVDVTDTLRPATQQRLIATINNPNEIVFRANNGDYSTAFFEIDGIDGTADYAITYEIKDNNTGYTPTVSIHPDASTSSKLTLMIYAKNGSTTLSSDKHFTLYNIQVEKGTTATAYEPYYTPLKDVVPNKADNSVIGTVEDGANPTKSYAVGEHMIRNGKFCTVTVAVTTSSTWTLDGNYVEGDVAQFTSLLFAGTIADIVSRLPIDNMSINCIIGSQLLLQLTSNTVNHTAFITVFKRGTEYVWYGKAAGADNEFCLGTFTANGYSNHRVI